MLDRTLCVLLAHCGSVLDTAEIEAEEVHNCFMLARISEAAHGKRPNSEPELAAVFTPTALGHRINEVTGELFEIDALLAGADSIVRDIQETAQARPAT